MPIAGTDWQERARCRDHDVGLFFPEKGETAWTAKRICMGCGVRQECLEYALRRGEAEGIWGGLTPAERRRLARSRRALA
jgi:WhiB family redox-sensing transcriptional regulator